MFAIYSQNHMKQMNTLLGENAQFLDIKAVSTYNYHCVLKG
jgi:hypothetical protein